MNAILNELFALSNPSKATHSSRFFKSGKGQYGEGDLFLGITVPKVREIVKRHTQASHEQITQLLTSPYHEARLCGALILVAQYPKAKQATYDFYLQHLQYINNWDLVDTSAPNIIGAYLLDKPKDSLYNWARSPNLWHRRIAIMATFTFIKSDQFDDTFQIATILLYDKEDLIHKAVGWMLREVGNRDRQTLEHFLSPIYTTMPRTMLRYAIEKFDRTTYQSYLNGTYSLNLLHN